MTLKLCLSTFSHSVDIESLFFCDENKAFMFKTVCFRGLLTSLAKASKEILSLKFGFTYDSIKALYGWV